MKPQFGKSIIQLHADDLLDEPLERHTNIIKHKAALLQKMLQYRPPFAGSLNVGCRDLKIQPFYAPRECNYLKVPRILMQGKWLRKIGFEIDDYARIITFPKLIIITSSCLEFRPFIEGPKTRVFMVGRNW